MNNKGQGELEAVAAVAIVCLIFAGVLVFNAQKNSEIALSGDFYAKAGFCRQLSAIISQMNYLEGMQKINLAADYDFNIIANNISLGNYWCSFSGNAKQAYLLKGIVIVQEKGDSVELVNQ